jgi:hypothetical protein
MTKFRPLGRTGTRDGRWLALGLLLIALLLASGGAAGSRVRLYAQTPDAANPDPAGIPAKIESSLAQLAQAYDQRGPAAARALSDSLALELEDSHVWVVIEGLPGTSEAIAAAVTGLGGQPQDAYADHLEAWLPIESLEALAAHPQVRVIRRPQEPILLDPAVGFYTTEGVAATDAAAWHLAGQKGSGVQIAIIDSEFGGYEGLLGSDLPATVKTYDWTRTGMGGGPHGAACAEIVHDMAPEATLYLHKVFYPNQLGLAVDQAIADDVDVISMSLGWATDGPGDGSGFLADIVSKARQNGIFYATAAGNEGIETWHGTYQDDGIGHHRWPSGQWVNELAPTIYAGQLLRTYLHWDDWSNTGQDYDLELYYWNGTAWQQVAGSYNRQSAGYIRPEESISVYAPVTGRYGLVVRRHSATRNACFRVLVPRIQLSESSQRRSLMFPADSPDAITAGALDVNPPYPLESYSSRGPTFGPGGLCSGGATKPDLGGYANVSSMSYGSAGFNGTSSATPHIAGAAAQVKGAYPSYTPAQIQSFLQQRARDQGPAGKDNEYGWGRLYLGAPPGGSNSPPTLSSLPDQTLSMDSVRDRAIDLWAYASDAESADSELAFTISNVPNPGAGVSIQGNRYVAIQPAGGWTGQTDVSIRVTDPGALSVTDDFRVTVYSTVKTWNGSSSQDWHRASNWSPAGVPTAFHDVIIPETAADPIISKQDAVAESLTIRSGATLDLTDRQLSVEGLVTNNGTLIQTQSVSTGVATPFLQITNRAGDEIAFYGLDVTPDAVSATNMPDGVLTAQASQVRVSVSGNQTCFGRPTAVMRCYDIETGSGLEATVRFYFREAERRGQELDALRLFRYDGAWQQEPGPYSHGSVDPAEALYVEVNRLDDFSPFALDTPGRKGSTLHFPFASR